jgi:hypothetical protein
VLITPQSLDSSGSPYLYSTFIDAAAGAGSTTYSFAITSSRSAGSVFNDLRICAWDVSRGGNPTKADYTADETNPSFDSSQTHITSITVDGTDAVCTRVLLAGTDPSSGAFSDYSDLVGAPNGTVCSAGDATTVNCIYGDPTAVLSSLCVQLYSQALSSARTETNIALNNAGYGCANSGLPLKGIAYGHTAYLDSQLDLYKTTAYMCYYFIGSDGSNNNFDFDDNWGVNIRTWVCGKTSYTYRNAGQGPEAQMDTPVTYYANCGPQADDTASYAWIDGAKHWFPYVHW